LLRKPNRERLALPRFRRMRSEGVDGLIALHGWTFREVGAFVQIARKWRSWQSISFGINDLTMLDDTSAEIGVFPDDLACEDKSGMGRMFVSRRASVGREVKESTG